MYSEFWLTRHQHKNTVVFMLPPIDQTTGYLPVGIHDAGWAEVFAALAFNSHREGLFQGLLAALRVLCTAGCQQVLLDGSFVSSKALPEDYDGAWEPQGVDINLIDPVLLDFNNKRAAMKSKYGGELFPASAVAAPGIRYRDFFQRDRNGTPKGIIRIDLGTLP